MANTNTQIHLQFIFAVRYRAALIQESWKDELYKYITGIVQANNHKVIIINGMLLGRSSQAIPLVSFSNKLERNRPPTGGRGTVKQQTPK